MGQFVLFFAGLLLAMITGIFGNWAVTSWYYHADHPELEQWVKYTPIIAFVIIFAAMFYVFWFLGTFAPFL